jgi:hypothetical protein
MNFKKLSNNPFVLVLVFVFLTWSAYSLGASSTQDGQSASVFSAIMNTLTGNGGPSGAHYELEIIGVPNQKSADMTGDNGHRIFVGLGSRDGASVTTKILLSQTTDGSFGVLDANGTDGVAAFKLPAPGTYTIWARALGKPAGTAVMTTCATDPTTGQQICSTQNSVFLRDTGKPRFNNVTVALTSIVLDPTNTTLIDACGASTVSLFDPCLQGYLWQYDNNGLQHLQVRFYSK